jgi:hypothetical protein
MSSEPQTFDPYRSPSLPEAPYAAAAPIGRPAWLTMLCVLCIVLGALGLINSLFGAAGLAGGKALQAWIQPKGSTTGMPPQMQEAQEKFQREMYAVQDKYFWVIVPSTGIRFFVALLLLVAGIRALALNERGRKLLLMACAVALTFELLSAILQSFLVMENLTITNSYIENITNSMPKDKRDAARIAALVQTISRAIGVVVLVITGIVILLKIALYAFGLIYLQKPHIQALFQSVAKPVPAPSS